MKPTVLRERRNELLRAVKVLKMNANSSVVLPEREIISHP
jgi:hypothetical protein